jgi:hypothetical protein
MVLYAAECLIILTHWKYYKSSYFVIFILRATLVSAQRISSNLVKFLNSQKFGQFQSLANFCSSYLAHRLGRVGLLTSLIKGYPSWVEALGTFIMYYSFHLENETTVWLLLNRLTSILYPLHYEKVILRRLIILINLINKDPVINHNFPTICPFAKFQLFFTVLASFSAVCLSAHPDCPTPIHIARFLAPMVC